MKIFFFLVPILLNFNIVPAQQALKPFPQHTRYFSSVIRPSHITQQQMDDSVRAFYKRWKERYINDDAGKGQFYVWVEGSVKNTQCVSEGQGYGMIITALMAGYDPDAQKSYDGLYRYFKSHPSKRSPYLMAWAQTNSFKDIDGTSASDGDIDIAYSLLLADAQWGSNGAVNYFKEAGNMTQAIMKQEINPKTFSVLLSNSVEADSKDYFDTRSSDFMPAHFKVFANLTGDGAWDQVVNANYTLFDFLQNKYSSAAGLLPDFIQHVNNRPVPARGGYLESKFDGDYNYNACRIPWRIATDFIITGDNRSKEFVEKINSWIKETTHNNPDNISAGYTLDGEDIKTRNFEAMSFIASFAVSAMVDLKNQDWLNKLWDYIESFDLDQYDYYDNSIKMISLLLLSGNYWVPAHN
jgi:endoglucanase